MLPAGQLIKFRFFSGRFLDEVSLMHPIFLTWILSWLCRFPLLFLACSSDGKNVLDTGWLMSETELRLRLHSSAKPSVIMNSQKIESSNLRVKLSVIGLKDDSPSVTVSMSAFSRNEMYRPLQQHSGWLLNPQSWLEYTIVSLDLCNLQLVLDFEELKACDSTPVHVGFTPLLSSCIMEDGKSQGMLCLPIMKPGTSQTIGWVKADFVEMDVHLSKDKVPMIYHDLVCPVMIKVMVLQVVPGHVGFFLEIKWPLQSKDGSWDFAFGSELFFDMNEFIDVILHCVFTHACQRRIIFSCFDPDICTVIRRKQNRFPVLFLTQGTTDVYDELMDIRNRSSDIAMHFAQSHNLLGVNFHTEDLLRKPEYIKKARTLGLLIFCWGKDTNNLDNQNILQREGVHGFVYDKNIL
uniref:Glycerophosphocholine phosphodiesterase 1 n=1 Tax=Eptatretus burgeri TaxID=7764 RepID=A0A8C4WY10_EPTBU